jgi:hypothetical protein
LGHIHAIRAAAVSISTEPWRVLASELAGSGRWGPERWDCELGGGRGPALDVQQEDFVRPDKWTGDRWTQLPVVGSRRASACRGLGGGHDTAVVRFMDDGCFAQSTQLLVLFRASEAPAPRAARLWFWLADYYLNCRCVGLCARAAAMPAIRGLGADTDQAQTQPCVVGFVSTDCPVRPMSAFSGNSGAPVQCPTTPAEPDGWLPTCRPWLLFSPQQPLLPGFWTLPAGEAGANDR